MGLSAKSRFTTIMVLTASIAMLLVGALAWSEGRQSLEDAEFTHLTSIRVAKSRQVEEYFQTINNQLRLMSQDQTVAAAMVKFSRGYRRLSEDTVPAAYDATLQRHYAAEFLPGLQENLLGGTADYPAFEPRSSAAKFLQHKYVLGETSALDDTPLRDYAAYHDQYHDGFADFLNTFGYYDVFLIDFDTGDIVYSVAKEVDLGTNLLNGPYRATGLADVVRDVMKDPLRGHVKIVDFAPYLPSLNAPASFMAAPIYNGQHVVGIIAFQLPVDKIQNIMTSNREWRKEGLGESGETYIVGHDFLMRSDSRFLMEDKERYFDYIRKTGLQDDIINMIDRLNTSILLQPVQTQGARAALRGEDGRLIAQDYRDVAVLVSYGKLNITGLDWGLVSEIDVDEAFSPIERLLRRILISTAIFIPIVAYLSFWLSRFFMRPVRQLTETAQTLRAQYDDGNTEVADAIKFETDGAAEYQDLAQEMNHVVDKARGDMADARARQSEYTALITSALPQSVADRFRGGDKHIFDEAKLASALFIQIENFTETINQDTLQDTVARQFSFDAQTAKLAQRYGIDLFQQMGMEYIAVCGLTTPFINHTERMLQFSQALITAVADFNRIHDTQLRLNLGLDIGPLFGALQSGDVLDYDILGDAMTLCREAGYLGPMDGLSVTDTAVKYLKSIDLATDLKKTKDTIVHHDKTIPIWWASGAAILTKAIQ